MNTEPMQSPTNRAEFERRFHLLSELMQQEKFKSNVSLENLAKVRFLPNGRIDFLSVNESTRCLVNSMAHFNNERMKSMLDEQENQKQIDENKDDNLE